MKKQPELEKDYYGILGIPEDADQETIRRAFRRLARQYHPDASGGSTTEHFRQIREAYEVLSDKEKRARYDRERQSQRARASETIRRPRYSWHGSQTFLPPSARYRVPPGPYGGRPATHGSRLKIDMWGGPVPVAPEDDSLEAAASEFEAWVRKFFW